MTLLDVDSVSIEYAGRRGTVAAVRDVSLSVAEGEAVGLVGESGCGKSTLALALLGYLAGRGRVTAGRIRFGGEDLAALSPAALRRVRGGGIGMVYQEAMAALNPSLRVGSQLAETLVCHRGGGWPAARQAARTMLAEVGLPDPDRVMGAYPHRLSGGQQQRVVIAMALLPRPRLLLLDEPTTALDVTVEAGIIDLLRTLCRAHGTALLFISHNLGLVAQLCDRVAVMYAGEIVESGTVADMFAAPAHPYTRGLIGSIPQAHLPRGARLTPIPAQAELPRQGCAYAPRCAEAREACRAGPIPLLPAPGRSVRCIRWAELPPVARTLTALMPAARQAAPIVSVQDLHKTFQIRFRGARREIGANRGVSFDVPEGATLAVVGESGCGKTTLANTLMGLSTATGGRITLDGANVAMIPVRARPHAMLRDLQMVFQNPDETLNPAYPVGRQIARAVRRLDGARGRAGVRARVAALFGLTRLAPALAGRRPRQLSGGQKQRVGIARALAGQPRILVADEPVSALDVSVQAAITDLLLDIQRQHGTTLIVISHDLGFVRAVADHIVVMYLGRVVEAGPAEQIFAPPYHPYTEALLSAVPSPDPSVRRRRIVLRGDPPSALDPPGGCAFHTRCPRRLSPVCDTVPPPEQLLPGGHRIACHIPLSDLQRVAPVFEDPTDDPARRDAAVAAHPPAQPHFAGPPV